jgi:hypothetical protein
MTDYTNILDRELYFLDFETNKAGDLFLLGIEHNNNFTCYVINENLSFLCENKDYIANYNIKYENHKSLITNLLKNIHDSNGMIVAYSVAELEIIQRIISKEKLPDIDYLNLARATRSWKNKFYKEAFNNLPELRPYSNSFIAKKNSLASIMRLLPNKEQAPKVYAPGKTTSRINDVIKGYKAKSKLTPVQKGKATKLLKHNHYDVTILKTLLEEIIKDDPKLLKKAIYKLTDNKS